jgi:hypothetical protein
MNGSGLPALRAGTKARRTSLTFERREVAKMTFGLCQPFSFQIGAPLAIKVAAGLEPLHRVFPPGKIDSGKTTQMHKCDSFGIEMSNVFRPFFLIEEDLRSFAQLDSHLKDPAIKSRAKSRQRGTPLWALA